MQSTADLTGLIRELDDASAVRSLVAVARVLAREENVETELTAEAVAALEGSFGDAEPAAPEAGDLARSALALLARDPSMAPDVARSLNLPSTRSFDAGSAMLLASAVLVALQTHVRFERDKRGRLSLLVEKKATSDSLLSDLAQKLLGWWKRGGE